MFTKKTLSRTWPIFFAAFLYLLILIGLAGWATVQRLDRIYAEVTRLQESYRRVDDGLDRISGETYRAGVAARDLLADSSPTARAAYAQTVARFSESARQLLARLEQAHIAAEKIPLDQLKSEVASYQRFLETIRDESNLSPQALKTLLAEGQPSRERIVRIAEEVDRLNEINARTEREQASRTLTTFRNQIWYTTVVAVLLGCVFSAANVYRILLLERGAVSQFEETQLAEKKLRSLSQQLVQTQEDERRRLSRELHDEIGQSLTALRMELGNLGQLNGKDSREFGVHLDSAKELTEQTLRTVRNISMGLRPSMLDDLGLGPALQWQANQHQRLSGTPVHIELDPALDELPDEQRTCLYRIVQEALTNCARHAKASKIEIRLTRKESAIQLTVSDNGVGFQSGVTQGSGLGLTGISERARELGGTASIHSEPGLGTLLEVRLPEQAPVERPAGAPAI